MKALRMCGCPFLPHTPSSGWGGVWLGAVSHVKAVVVLVRKGPFPLLFSVRGFMHRTLCWPLRNDRHRHNGLVNPATSGHQPFISGTGMASSRCCLMFLPFQAVSD